MIRADSFWMGLRTQRVSLANSGSSRFIGEDSPHLMFLRIVHVVPAFATTHFVALLTSNPNHRAIMEVPESFTLFSCFASHPSKVLITSTCVYTMYRYICTNKLL